MKNIAIIGAGVMGSDVALDLACFGYRVLLKDLDLDILQKAKERIVSNLRMIKMMRNGLDNITIDTVMEKIRFSADYDEFDNLDYIIENITEDWEAKVKLYSELKYVCPTEVLYFVNTSCISITKIASLVSDPKKVIGMHFMNPVFLKELVEVVKGYHTSEDTIEQARQFLQTIKKRPVIVNDLPGFVANRLSHLFMNEAAFLIQEHVASAREIDLIFTKGYGHPMGPLATADLIGLDTVVQSLKVLYQNYQDTKFRCCPLLTKMVDAGLLGKKSGEGFYKY